MKNFLHLSALTNLLNMLIKTYLSTITSIQKNRIELGLCDGKLAYIPVHEINDYLKIELKSHLDNEISNIFKIGNRILCGVSKIEEDKEFAKIIPATYKPSEINQNIPFSTITLTTTVYGVVTDVEDHGFLIDCGIAGKKCFINRDSLQNFSKYQIGMPVFFRFNKLTSSLNVLPGKICSHSQYDGSESVSLITLLPGSFVIGIVSNTTDNKIELKCSNLTVSIKLTNFLGKVLKVEDEVKARIISFDHISKKIHGSLLPHLLEDKNHQLDIIQVPINYVAEDAKIFLLEKKSGVLTFTYNDIEYKGFFKRDHLESGINSTLQIDKIIPCKVMKRSFLENHCLVSVDSTVINTSSRKSSSIEVGDLVNGEVKTIKEKHYVIKLPELNSLAVLPLCHASSKKKQKNQASLAVGDTLKVRIFTKSLKLLHVTALHPFVSSRLPILGSGEFHRLLTKCKQSGEIKFFVAIIKNISEKGIHVHGLDNTSGLIPLSHIPGIGSYDFAILDNIYKKGKLIKFFVNNPERTKTEDKFFVLSMKHEDLESEDNLERLSQAKIGSIYTCTVWAVKSRGFSVNLSLANNKQLPAFLPFEHCSDCCVLTKVIQRQFCNVAVTGEFPLKVVVIQTSPVLIVSGKTSLTYAVNSSTSHLFPMTKNDFDVGKTFFGWVISHQDYGLMIQFPERANLIALLPFRFMRISFDYRDKELLEKHYPRGLVLPLNIREVTEESRKEKNSLKILVQIDKRHLRSIPHADILHDCTTLMNWTWSLTSSGTHGPCEIGSKVNFTFNKVAPLKDEDYQLDQEVGLGLVTLKKGKTPIRAILLNHCPSIKVGDMNVKCHVASTYYTQEPCLLLVRNELKEVPMPLDKDEETCSLTKMACLVEFSSLLVCEQNKNSIGLISNADVIGQAMPFRAVVSCNLKNNFNIYTLQEEEFSVLLKSRASLVGMTLQNYDSPDYLYFKHPDYAQEFICHMVASGLDKEQVDSLMEKNSTTTTTLESLKKLFLQRPAKLLGIFKKKQQRLKTTKRLIQITFLPAGDGDVDEGSLLLARITKVSPYSIDLLLGSRAKSYQLHRTLAVNDEIFERMPDHCDSPSSLFISVIVYKKIECPEGTNTYLLTTHRDMSLVETLLQPKVNDTIFGYIRNNLKYGLVASVNPNKDVLVPISKRLKASLRNLKVEFKNAQRIKLKFLGDNRAVLAEVVDEDLLLKRNYDQLLSQLISSIMAKEITNINLVPVKEKDNNPTKNNRQDIVMNPLEELEKKYLQNTVESAMMPDNNDENATNTQLPESRRKSQKRNCSMGEEDDDDESDGGDEKVGGRRKRLRIDEKELNIAKKEEEKGKIIQTLDNSRNHFDLSLLNSKEAFELAVSNRPNVISIWNAYFEFVHLNDPTKILAVRNIFDRAMAFFTRENSPENDKSRAALILSRLRLECDHRKRSIDQTIMDEDIAQRNLEEAESIIEDLCARLKCLSVIPKIRESINILIEYELFDRAEGTLKWLIKQVKPLTTNLKDWTSLARLNYIRGDVQTARNYQMNAAKFLKTTLLAEFAINIASLEIEHGDQDRALAILEEQVTKNVKSKRAHLVYIQHLLKLARYDKAKLIASNALKGCKNIQKSDILSIFPDYRDEAE